MKLKRLLIGTASALLISSGLSLGQAPNLGTAASFALFTAAGAFSNVGSSVVSGDIGTNVGAFDGSGVTLTLGQAHVANPTSASAATDVQTAYSSLAGATCGTTILPELGGQTLTPGVSCQPLATPTSLNGTLTLDGQGNSSAVFIIKLNSALSTAVGSNIVLTNGASSANVYFQINGAVGLGEASIFRGTILADGAISLGNAAFLDGRGLSTAGAISLLNTIVTRPGATALPVTLVGFTAKVAANYTIDLAWTTSLETNNKGFIVERSKDLKLFEKVGEVNDVAVNSTALTTYHLLDRIPYSGTSYYRLKQTDLSGKVTVYPSVSVVLRDDVYGVFPNPVVSEAGFVLRLDEPETAMLHLYNVSGQAMPVERSANSSSSVTVKALSKLMAGIYVLTVAERGVIRQHRLVIP